MKNMRRWYTISFTNDGWVCTERGDLIAQDTNKAPLVKLMTARLHREWREEAKSSELTIKGKNGRIQDRRPYGLDPRRSKG